MRALAPAFLFFAAGLAYADEGPAGGAALPPIPLREAVEKGLVAASGSDPGSYCSVTLKLQSRAAEPLALDLAGSHLRNRTGTRCQRLGLGPPLAGELGRPGDGRLLVDLAPGQKATLRLQTVCLDSGLPAPGKQEFELAPEALPEVREKVLRWWMDNRDAPQSAVNEAIWQFRGTVHVEPGVVKGYEKPEGTFGALHGGTAFRVRDGELLSIDRDGIRRFLGTEIFQALPTANGLYAIGLGADRKPELWRFALTGEQPWGRVLRLSVQVRLKEVLPVGTDRLVLVTDVGVIVADPKEDKVLKVFANSRALDVSAVRRGEHGLEMVFRIPGNQDGGPLPDTDQKERQDTYELWRLDLRTLKEELVKRYWNVESVVAGCDGVYGLTHVGRLRVLVGDDFRNLPATEVWRSLLAVGREVLWVAGADGRIAVVNRRTGATLRATTVSWIGEIALSVDSATGDLGMVNGGRFLRIRAADGTAEVIDAPAASAGNTSESAPGSGEGGPTPR